MSRFVRPESVRLALADDGDWIVVKRRLTAGEERHAYSKIFKPGELGKPRELDYEQAGLAKMVAYLLDWSFADDQGTIVPIRDQSLEAIEAALLGLDPLSFREVHDLIVAHEAREAEALDAEKKTRSTTPPSSRTYTSVA